MERLSRRISLLCMVLLVLSCTAAHAIDNYTMSGEDAKISPPARQAFTYSPAQAEVVKAFTRELAFIRTFAVETPSQYEQKRQGEGLMGYAQLQSTGGKITDEEIRAPESRSSQLKHSAPGDTKHGKTKKNNARRKK